MAGQNKETSSPETSEQSDSHSSYVVLQNNSTLANKSESELDVEQSAEQTEQTEQGAQNSTEQSKPYCAFFQEGKCRFGDSCLNLHEADPNHKPKQKRKNKKEKKKSAEEEETCWKCRKQKKKLRTVMDVVNRVQWDEQYNPEHFIVGYLDRFDGLVEEEFLNFDWSDVTTVDDWESFCIPKHRVYYFKQHGEVVWDRKTRTDKIFTDKEINCDQCDKT